LAARTIPVADAASGQPIECAEARALDAGRPVLLALADGMGGENAGDVASAITLTSVAASLAKKISVHYRRPESPR